MSVIYEVEHVTTYRYAKPVTFGPHKAMFLPRGNYSGRLLGYSLEVNVPAVVHWVSDTLSNNVAVIDIGEPAQELTVSRRTFWQHRH